MLAHGILGVLATRGSAAVGWYPFGDAWVFNGLAFAAAAEGTVRANLAGLQISAAGKVWSIANSAAIRISEDLGDSSRSAIKTHLSTLSDAELAELTAALLQALRFMDGDKATVHEANLVQAAQGQNPTRTLLLRIAAAVAADAYWVRDE